MSRIYHLVPENMIGEILIPLNVLKAKQPKVYDIELTKYRGREKILERKIPLLNCVWNDVLHFSAVSPDIIFSRFEELGFGKFHGIQWFEVPAEAISTFPAVVYRAPKLPSADFSIGAETVEPFISDKWVEPLGLSAEADAYFLKSKTEARTPLPFQFTPHILVRGELSVNGLKIVSR